MDLVVLISALEYMLNNSVFLAEITLGSAPAASTSAYLGVPVLCLLLTGTKRSSDIVFYASRLLPEGRHHNHLDSMHSSPSFACLY